MNRTRLDRPAARLTRWKPFSCRGGSPAEAGQVTYSWATSVPERRPVLVTVALTWTSCVPGTLRVTRSPLYLNEV